MNLGFLTNCFEGSILEKVDLAVQLGFTQLEVFLTPDSIQQLTMTEPPLKKQFVQHNIGISSLAYYQNILTENKELRKKHIDNLYKLINFSYENDISLISTFLGRDMHLSIKENFDLLPSVFQPIVTYAEQLNIQIAIENCSMPSWDKNGFPSTISYSPELWSEMFSRIPNANFGLNFDPSHLVWQQIDYKQVLCDYYERIFNIHIKEVQVEKDNLSRYGIFGKQVERNHPYDFGWYKPAPLGTGSISWTDIFKTLQAKQYNKSLTLEFKSSSKQEATQTLIDSKKFIETKLIREDF
ncbi:hypothetical protein IGI37_003098 [Enterococcus sp. AZ194]|uniref:sugar phosphate isomerase/epimerase family protein n=1 Tax=Enterococcus sp. AZ194 TaxID=2774629 RepID=UPI003F207B9A